MSSLEDLLLSFYKILSIICIKRNVLYSYYLIIECSVNGFYRYSLIIINYGTTLNLSFWYHTAKYINMLNYALQFKPDI